MGSVGRKKSLLGDLWPDLDVGGAAAHGGARWSGCGLSGADRRERQAADAGIPAWWLVVGCPSISTWVAVLRSKRGTVERRRLVGALTVGNDKPPARGVLLGGWSWMGYWPAKGRPSKSGAVLFARGGERRSDRGLSWADHREMTSRGRGDTCLVVGRGLFINLDVGVVLRSKRGKVERRRLVGTDHRERQAAVAGIPAW